MNKYFNQNHPMTRKLPLVGIIPQLLKNPLQALIDASQEGDVVRLNIPKLNVFLVHNPEDVREVLTDNTLYIKGDMVKPFQKLFGTSVLTSVDDEWIYHRKIVQPAFHHQNLYHFANIFCRETIELTDSWDTINSIQCLKEMRKVTQQIIVKALFGTDLNHIKEHVIDQALDDVLGLMGRVMWTTSIPEKINNLIPSNKAYNQRFKHGKRLLHAIIDTIIKIKEKHSDPDHDLLDMLLKTRFEDGSSIPIEQIHDEIITFFVAGHETTTPALVWAWTLLDQNPTIREKFYAEIDAIDHDLGFTDLPNLIYTRSIFYEALRIGTPSWFIPRITKNNTTLKGVNIPAGSIIITSPYLAHRHPLYWENPEQFNPDRFATLPDLRRPPHFYAFGFGSRQCIAKEFALMEGALILGNIAKKYELRLKYPEQPIVPHPGMTLQIQQRGQKDIPMTLHRR